MIYLDSSALVKLVITEAETPGLMSWLAERADFPMVSSVIHRTEVARAVWRADPSALPRCFRKLRGVEMVALTSEVTDSAGAMPPQALRSMEAIHLAAAASLRPHLAAFVAYDKRLLDAAEAARLPIASPQ